MTYFQAEMASLRSGWRGRCGARWREMSDSERRGFDSVTDLGRAFDFGRQWLGAEDETILRELSAQWRTEKDDEAAHTLRGRGNERFRAKDYVGSVSLYTQGLRYSSADNPETSLLYANRSAALYYLQRYQECLLDVGRAERHNYPQELQHKTRARRAACLQQLNCAEGGIPSPVTQQSPSQVEGEGETPAAISLRVHSSRGRYYVACRDLRPGQVVLQEEAFAAVLIPGELSEETPPTQDMHCHHCMTLAHLPLPCGTCSFSSYCSESCRDLAWHQYHWLDCPLAGLLLALGTFAHLALRTVLIAGMPVVERVQSEAAEGLGEEGGRRPEISPYQLIHSLLTHSERQPPAHRFLCALTAAALCLAVWRSGLAPRLLGPGAETEPGPNSEAGGSLRTLGVALIQHMLQLQCNAQAISTVRDTGVGCARVLELQQLRIATALFPRASLFNHSCEPNTGISFHKTSLTVRASQHIPAGQEVFHCYGPHVSRAALRERQQALRTQYFFQCGCHMCVREEGGGHSLLQDHFLCQHCSSTLSMLEEARYECVNSKCGYSVSELTLHYQLNAISSQLQRASSLISTQPEKAQQQLHQCQDEARKLLPAHHPLSGKIQDSLAQLHASQGDWRRAAQHLRESVGAVRRQFGPNSLELAQQLFKLAQVLFNGRSLDELPWVLREAEMLLTTHYGPQHPMLGELRDMRSCLHIALTSA
ncbi:SET and MYND domain-containing protein 4 isoform X2 [Narcine bancroftii]|uniref:SET and MYND domain-containing protein 4 isoform X2 n=1 Tax=Narcine bancroftii TaxID=1343680 RepID=UPI0038310707